MLSTNSVTNSRSVVNITTGTASSVAAAAAASMQNAGTSVNAPIPDKTEINDAVTKVLEGYDWTLVPIATK